MLRHMAPQAAFLILACEGDIVHWQEDDWRLIEENIYVIDYASAIRHLCTLWGDCHSLEGGNPQDAKFASGHMESCHHLLVLFRYLL